MIDDSYPHCGSTLRLAGRRLWWTRRGYRPRNIYTVLSENGKLASFLRSLAVATAWQSSCARMPTARLSRVRYGSLSLLR